MGEPHVCQLLWRGSAIGLEIVEHPHHIGVTGYDPCVQERVPMYRVLVSQPMVKRIRIGQNFRV